MATVTKTPTTTPQKVTRPNLVIGGRVIDAHGAPAAVDLQLTVALEAVVADDADPTVYEVYGVEVRTDADGRFADSYDLADDVRASLAGWVKCTVQICPQPPEAPIRTKVVRWMRPTSDQLIAGLSALLANVTCVRDSLNKK
jgi:hypothetical protein